MGHAHRKAMLRSLADGIEETLDQIEATATGSRRLPYADRAHPLHELDTVLSGG